MAGSVGMAPSIGVFGASVEFSISTSPTNTCWYLQLCSFVSHYTKTTIWSKKRTNPKGKTCWKQAETASQRIAALSFNKLSAGELARRTTHCGVS